MKYLEQYMVEAIAEARKVQGKTHPNPAVGAVIVHRDRVIATGATAPVGGPHAEIVALDAMEKSGHKPDAETTLYVTLEPCSTVGRTGACTDRIIQSGIRQIVVGATDLNLEHQGKGLEILKSAGIEVVDGVLAKDCEYLNLIFNWWQSRGEVFVAGKIATTIDGRIATRGGLSKWITGEKARADVHHWRRYFPAIAVGAGTVAVDDPCLSAREEGLEEWSPIRFVFDRNLTTFKETLPSLYTDKFKERTVVITMQSKEKQAAQIREKFGVEIWLIQAREDEGIGHFLEICKEKEIYGIYIEGGAHLLSTFLKTRRLHYLFSYRAPKLLADTSGLAPFMGQEPFCMQETIQLENVRHETFGDDQLMSGYIKYPKEQRRSIHG